MKEIVCLCLLALLCHFSYAKRVAIIGAGIAGASTAFYANQFGGDDVELHVFEKNSIVGGRLKHATIGGQVVDIGGDAWSSVNTYIQSLVAELNVPLSDNSYYGNGQIGYYEGGGKWNIFAEDTTSETNLGTQIELFETRLQNNYKIRDNAYVNLTFQTVDSFLLYGNLFQYTPINISTFAYLHGISQEYLWNEVLPVTRGIYDQNLSINAFAGIVSLLPNLTPAYSAAGGNDVLVQTLLNASGAKVSLSTTITEVTKHSGGYQLVAKEKSIPLLFDDVVLAGPIEFADISFSGVSLPRINPRKFVHWFVTLILCEKLNPAYFINVPFTELPDFVFTTGNSTAPFVVVYPVAQATSGLVVFKIFSNEDVSSILNSLFIGVQEHIVQHWPYTFPDLSPQQSYQPIILDSGLYYTSGLESVATAMEISTLAGRNIALLITKKW